MVILSTKIRFILIQSLDLFFKIGLTHDIFYYQFSIGDSAVL